MHAADSVVKYHLFVETVAWVFVTNLKGTCHRLKKLVQQVDDSSFVGQVVDRAVRSMLAAGSIAERQVVASAAEVAPIVTWLAGPIDSILLEVVPSGWRVLGCEALRCRRSGSLGT